MKQHRYLLRAAVAAAVCAAAASAVIKVDLPVSKILDSSSAVLTGTVTQVTAQNKVVDVKVASAAKGQAEADTFRVQVLTPPDLAAQVTAGSPAVLMVARDKGGAVALLHLADTWLMVERVAGSSPPAWRTLQVYDGKQAFPGRTAALVRLVGEMKAGKHTLLNRLEPNFFRGPVRELGRLNVARPAFLAAADFSGDKKTDLVVGSAAGLRLWLAAASGYQDATAGWGLADAPASLVAVGDANGDSRPDLLRVWTGGGGQSISAMLHINASGKFAAAPVCQDVPGPAAPLAAALTDASGDGRPDAIILLADGRLFVFENPAAAGAAWRARPEQRLWQDGQPLAAAIADWTDSGRPSLMAVRTGGVTCYHFDGSPPDDHERLTGAALSAHWDVRGGGLKNASAAAADVNGDRRPDLLISADGGAMVLVNRGFGTFFVNLDAGILTAPPRGQALPPKLLPPTVWTVANLYGDGTDDLLVLTDDGRLIEVSNPAEKGP